MAKGFNLKLDKEIVGFVKKSNEKAQLPLLKFISNTNLIDYPHNSEDLHDISDIENSIRELGFTDPLEVTPYKEEKYMILSGHRRRLAGVNTGMETFPCLVKRFDNNHEIKNYVLLANSQRDSSKDPLLYAKRYKMHEAYLTESGFNGNKREEIAKRLGISIPQADRYNYFNKIISPVWDLVKNESVGMSSVLGMSTFSIEDQNEVYQIFLKYLEYENRISREKCDLIIRSFKAGKKPEDILLAAITENNKAYHGESIPNGNIYAQGQLEQINKLKDIPPADKKEESTDADADNNLTETSTELDESETTAENEFKKEIPSKTFSKDERQRQRGMTIGKKLEKLSSSINKGYEFADKETAKVTLKSMSEFITLMFSEIQEMAVEYEIDEIFDALKKELKILIEQSK